MKKRGYITTSMRFDSFKRKSKLQILNRRRWSIKNVSTDFVERNGLNNRAEFAGWISQEALPDYLNNIRLIVLPCTEGLPNVMLELWLCTPVLPPLGMIPEVIVMVDRFIMENNSPGVLHKCNSDT